jgi:hypothetical protein
MQERRDRLDVEPPGALVGGDDAVQADDRHDRAAAAERPCDPAQKSGVFRHQATLDPAVM